MSASISEIVRIAVTIAVTVAVTIGLLFLSTHILRRHEARSGPQIHVKFAYNVVRLFILLLAVATIGSQFTGFSRTVTTILASSGIVALAISLAAQESLTNIIDGLFISMFKPFNIGDRITLPEKNDLTGFVTAINLRHTVITTYNKTSYIIPNSVMSSAIVENSSAGEEAFAYPIDVSISYNSDLEKAMSLMMEAITSHPAFNDIRTEEEKAAGKPATTILVRDFGDSGITLRCQMITHDVKESFVACSEARIAIKRLFDENGIVIPYQTIHIDNPPRG